MAKRCDNYNTIHYDQKWDIFQELFTVNENSSYHISCKIDREKSQEKVLNSTLAKEWEP